MQLSLGRILCVVHTSLTTNLEFSLAASGALMAVSADALVQGIVTAVAMLVWIYVSHRTTHRGQNPIMHELHRRHHDPDPAVSGSFIAHAMELVSTLVGGGLLFLMAPTWLLHRGTVVFSTLMYTTVHLYNYHCGMSPEHREHHADPTTNYGPGFIDYLMGTSDTIELLGHMVPNVFCVMLLTLCVSHWRWLAAA